MSVGRTYCYEFSVIWMFHIDVNPIGVCVVILHINFIVVDVGTIDVCVAVLFWWTVFQYIVIRMSSIGASVVEVYEGGIDVSVPSQYGALVPMYQFHCIDHYQAAVIYKYNSVLVEGYVCFITMFVHSYA